MRWPHRITNKALSVVHFRTLEARWRFFSHVLRLQRDLPVQTFIDEYFLMESGMEGPHTTLPSVLDNDLRTIGKRLHNTANLKQLYGFWQKRSGKLTKNPDVRVWCDARGDQKPETFFLALHVFIDKTFSVTVWICCLATIDKPVMTR